MTKNNKARAGLIAGAALAAMAVAGIAGSTIANAADSSTSSSSSASSSTAKKAHVAEEALTGATADSVKAAVLAKYPGATIDKMEKDSDGTSVYEAYITKADGTKAKVLLDSTFAITGEDAHAKGGHGPDGAKGGKGAHAAEEALTGATADSVKAAVLAKYPGATIDRMEKDSDGTSVYEAHITKADGTKAHVQLDANFVITGEHTMAAKGGSDGQAGMRGKGGHGHEGGKHGEAPASASSGSNA
jgi:uncharacterized membrane protein YkoI